MTILTFTVVVGLGSFAAGLVGALTGLGGGVVIVPLLVMACGVDIRYAIGASLVSVIATSSGAAAAFVSEGYSNIKVAMLLEIATTSTALQSKLGFTVGAIVAAAKEQTTSRPGSVQSRARADARSTLRHEVVTALSC